MAGEHDFHVLNYNEQKVYIECLTPHPYYNKSEFHRHLHLQKNSLPDLLSQERISSHVNFLLRKTHENDICILHSADKIHIHSDNSGPPFFLIEDQLIESRFICPFR